MFKNCYSHLRGANDGLATPLFHLGAKVPLPWICACIPPLNLMPIWVNCSLVYPYRLYQYTPYIADRTSGVSNIFLLPLSVIKSVPVQPLRAVLVQPLWLVTYYRFRQMLSFYYLSYRMNRWTGKLTYDVYTPTKR